MDNSPSTFIVAPVTSETIPITTFHNIIFMITEETNYILRECYQVLNWIFFGVCTVAFVARVWIRYSCFKRFLLEDYLMLVALAIHNAEAVLIQIYVRYAYELEAAQKGELTVGPDFFSHATKGLVAIGICVNLTIVGVLIVKINFLLFFRRLASHMRQFVIAWWLVLAFCVGGTIAQIGMQEFGCFFGSAEYIFSAHCTGDNMQRIFLNAIFSAVVDAVSDVLIIGFPVAILWSTKISKQKKLVLTMTYLGLVLSISFLSFGIAIYLCRRDKRSGLLPPLLSETIPFVSNALPFATDKDQFLSKLHTALKEEPIIRCRIGPVTLYYVSGPSSVSALFRSSSTSDPWVLRILEKSGGYARQDVLQFVRNPRPRITKVLSPEHNIWHAKHSIFNDALLGRPAVAAFSDSFQTFFKEHIDAFAPNEWNENVQLFDFLKHSIFTAATKSVLGSRIIETNPGFADAFWKYERFVEPLAFGLPAWMNRQGSHARNQFRDMCLKWYKEANERIDNENADLLEDVVAWDTIFGSSVSRKLSQWARTFNFSAQSQGGAYGLFLFGLHANTIPICTWMMIEVVKDPELMQLLKEEVLRAKLTDENNNDSLDPDIVSSLPLLQSVYTEVLRLHIRVLITRTTIEPVMIGRYNLPKGSIVQAPTEAGHLDDLVWGTSKHPASEFWAYRHVKKVATKDSMGRDKTQLQFTLDGKSGSFFPFGGGLNMCAGRSFAKQEVLLAVAMMISCLRIEFKQWIHPDGAVSDRPAMDDTRFANSVACPPDRDMKLEWMRT